MDRLLPWLRSTGIAYLVVALLLLALAWRVSVAGDRHTQPAVDAAGLPELTAPRAAGPVVHVAGAVRRPGVYRVAPGARVTAAIERAGGARSDASTDRINLAARVVDGQQIVVPVGTGDDRVPGEVGGAISLANATAPQLETLDGVGPTLAARIIAWRDENGGFRSIDQLIEVPGIGEGRLAAIRDQVAL